MVWIDGLPPAAHERVERQRASGTAGSLLSAPAAAAARAAGLAPVGEVFGCLVMNLGWSGGFCGAYGYSGGFGGGLGGFGGAMGMGWTSPVVSSADPGGSRNGFGPYVHALEHAWSGALARLRTEARALGADGVVGVRMARTPIDGSAHEFSALGTAVRVADRELWPGQVGSDLWTADLSAEDCAAAVLSGALPRGIVFGLAVTTKHEDWQIRNQRMSYANSEVTGLSELLTKARSDARRRLVDQAGRLGDGNLAVTAMTLRDFETACGEEKDLHAEASFTGTVLARAPRGVRSRSRPTVLPVLPVGGVATRTTRRDPRHG